MATLPQNVAFEQAKQEIANAINYCIITLQVPPFMVETIISSFYDEIHNQVASQFQSSLAEYNKEVEAEQQKAPALEKSEI